MDQPPDRGLAGKVALVTGAAHGIGRAIAGAFAAAGCPVVLADLDAGAAQDVAAAIETERGTPALALQLDVSDASSVERMVETVVARFGGIDILVNCAGIYPNSPVLEIAE